MLSTLTIISIFAEIIAAGLLFSGALAFFYKFFLERRLKNLFLGMVFFSVFFYVGLTLGSQLIFNLGRPLGNLILMQKLVSASILAAAFFIWSFIVEKFSVRHGRIISAFLAAAITLFLFRIAASSVNLVYREDIIEPVVNYSLLIPVKSLFALAWTLLAVFSFAAAFRTTGGEKKLFQYSGFSALLFLSSLAASFFYSQLGEPIYLLASWGLVLFATIGLLLGEIIPQESHEALLPLSYLRTRMLFKLVLIFVVLIVILFEITTLATMSVSKRALSQNIKASYFKAAKELSEEIQRMSQPPSTDYLLDRVSRKRMGENVTAFIVDSKGKLLAHPDINRVFLREGISLNEAAQKVMREEAGMGEFRDELGIAMVGGYFPVKKFGWGVVVEEPVSTAYFEMRRLETNSLLFIIAGIILTSLVGVFFARSIEKPIKELTLGTEAVSRGELGYKISISSADEIGKLAEAFNLMTKDLRDSQERLILSEKLASLGTMAAGMAHEIKNPLVSLRTFTQLLEQKWDDKEFREKFSSIIPHEIERINRIAESLLKFGRPMKPELTRVDVNLLIEEVLLLFESECKKYNVRVAKKLADLPEIQGDAGQLSQAFVNIIKNGIEAMQNSGGELIVKTDIGEVVKLGKIERKGVKMGDETVWGEGEAQGAPIPAVFVEITDSGEGISDENIKSLFDPFFTTKMSGTGMGLPITLRIIEEHKGSIKVKSQKRKGTTFIITLPQKIA